METMLQRNTGLYKKRHTLLKIYFTKTVDAKSMSCVRMERKSLRVLIWISRQVPGAHGIIVCQGELCSKWRQPYRRKLSACWNSPRRQCQVCNDISGHVMERIRQPESLSTTGTSVGRAELSIWHLPRYAWGSHRVLVRCENNFESSPFSLYIARRNMFNSTCKIYFWKCILIF
jgi:hypothetical protein